MGMYVGLEFKINKYVTLKLEDGKTNIYVNDKLFDQCKSILTVRKIYELEDLLEMESVDELVDKTIDHSLRNIKPELIDIPVETRFWVHCSNLQVWVESNYDTCMLHRNLAFPLLHKLAEIGDPIAKRVFKEEIAKRFSKGTSSVVEFLNKDGILRLLNKEELLSLLEPLEGEGIVDLEKAVGKELVLLSPDFDPYTQGFWLEGKHVAGFYLEDCDLKYLPDSIGNFKHLKALYLRDNNLKELPKSIGKLKSLEMLDLANNNLFSIPKSVGNLKCLKELKLSDNKLSILPESLKNLKLLRILYTAGNNIEKVPDFIEEMKKKGANIRY